MSKTLLVISLLFASYLHCQPANDDCSNATTLTIDDPTTCGENSTGGSLEVGECFTNYGGGSTEYTSWYRITANNDSLVLNMIYTNNVNCFPHLTVLGPFGTGAGCVPNCAAPLVYDQLQNGDPGNHPLLTGLTVGSDYLIQVQTDDCGGPGDGHLEYCIGVAQPSQNATSSGANLIDECGTAFSSTTDGGYWQSGTGTGFANLDGNAGTTCGACIAGNDVSFVINNAAWSTFCSLVAGDWQITVDNVSGCALTGAGVQAAVFTGTTGALVNEGESSPVPGIGWTSPTITVNAGECAYLMIDGFAGDMCNYDVTLTNLTSTCTILGIEFLDFNANRSTNQTHLSWNVASEKNNQKFVLESSVDGETFTVLGEVASIGDHNSSYTYDFTDTRAVSGDIYYRLSAVNAEGEITGMKVKFLKGDVSPESLEIYPNPTENAVNFDFYSPIGETVVQVEIFSMSGTKLVSENLPTSAGMNYFQLYIDDLEAGNYVFRLTSIDDVQTTSFFKK